MTPARFRCSSSSAIRAFVSRIFWRTSLMAEYVGK